MHVCGLSGTKRKETLSHWMFVGLEDDKKEDGVLGFMMFDV